MKTYINTIITSLLALTVFGQAGELDLAFNGDGIFTQDFNGDGFAQTAALQPDGKILIGGRLDGSDDDLLLMRLDTYGNPDLTFGSQGYTIVDYLGDDEQIQSIAVTPSGQIITLSECDSANVTGALFTRFFSNGQIDQSYGDQGHKFVNTPTGSNSNTWNDMALLQDGSVLATGRVNATGGYTGGILKMNSSGQVDQSFGTNGLLQLSNNGSNVNLKDLEALPNGDFFVLGSTTLQGNRAIYLAKLDASGNMVSTFGGNGYLVLGLSGAPFPKHLLIKPDGKIFITAQAYINGWSQIVNIQLLNTGQLDQSFGTNGRTDTQILFGHTNANASALLPDGKFLLTGSSDGPWNEDFALARLKSDGSLDKSFHFDGYVTKNVGGGNDYVADAVLQLDGRMVLVGNSANQSDNIISAARFLTGYSSAIEINENAAAINLVAYPNPCSDWLRIEAPANVRTLKAQLFNLQGNMIWDKMIDPANAIDMQALSAGLYILRLQTSSGDVQHQKIQVMR